MNLVVDNVVYVADMPAKSMIAGVKGHTGYSSCLYCDTIGEYSDLSLIHI